MHTLNILLLVYVSILALILLLKILLDLPIVIITDKWLTAGTTLGPFIILQKQ